LMILVEWRKKRTMAGHYPQKSRSNLLDFRVSWTCASAMSMALTDVIMQRQIVIPSIQSRLCCTLTLCFG
jgi:hypothetical protein